MRQLMLLLCLLFTGIYSAIHAQPTYLSSTIFSGGSMRYSTPADVNQDGEIDILVANGALYWLENDGDENFITYQVSTDNASNVTFGDINNDGAVDIVATFIGSGDNVVWFENDGNENFTAHAIESSLSFIQALFVIDLDGNGTLDVLAGGQLSNGLFWYDNDGSGNFTKKTVNSTIKGQTRLYAADINNNGHIDVLSSNSFTKDILWYENDGNENFTAHTIETNLSITTSLIIEDINEDGLNDILTVGNGNATIAWYRNDGGGSFTRINIATDYDFAYSALPFDWDGDGDKDLTSASIFGERLISIWENDGSENFTRHDIRSGIPSRYAHPIDMDGDGDVDIIGEGDIIIDYIEACTGTDGDNDGYGDDCDCNDNDSSIYPGAPQTCNNKDNDCNGVIDEQEANFVDGVSPSSVLCNNPTVELDEDGQYTFTGSDVFQSGADDCSTVSFLSANPAMVDCEDARQTIEVTVTAQDEEGNTATCISNVTVEDNIPPTALCKDATVYLDELGTASISISDINNNSYDNCLIAFTILGPSSFDCDNIGSNTVTLTLIDIGNGLSSCTANVQVIDNILPTALCQDVTIALDGTGIGTISVEDINNASYDNCPSEGAVVFPQSMSLSQTQFDCNDVGIANTVTLTVTDMSGNISSCTASVTVEINGDFPSNWTNTDIGQIGMGNDYWYDPCEDSPLYNVTGSGNNTTSLLTDNIAFTSTTLCGDGSITAKIESVDHNGYGGLMIRESTDAGAKQVSVFSNMSNFLRHESRNTTNGMKQVNQFFKPSPTWLKLERQGDWIFAYYSSTGSNFQYVHGVFVPMQSCVEIGLASFTYLPGSQTEAVFSNVTITGDNGGFTENNPTPDVSHPRPLSGEAGSTLHLVPRTLHLFPNPNNGQFTIKFDEPLKENTVITFFNSIGQVVKQQSVDVGTISVEADLNQEPAGHYTLRIDNGTAVPMVKKMIIAK